MRRVLLALSLVPGVLPSVPTVADEPADCAVRRSLPGLEAASIGASWTGIPGFSPRRRDPSRFVGPVAPDPLFDGRDVEIEVRTEPAERGRIVRAVIVAIDHPRAKHGALIEALTRRWGEPVRARDKITAPRKFGLVEATAWVDGACDVRAILVAWQDTTPRGLELQRVVVRLEPASDLAPLFEAIARDL
ncbi:MAG: hypothetical protein Kow0062_22460 [Acidobacteriota bacterium]